MKQTTLPICVALDVAIDCHHQCELALRFNDERKIVLHMEGNYVVVGRRLGHLVGKTWFEVLRLLIEMEL